MHYYKPKRDRWRDFNNGVTKPAEATQRKTGTTKAPTAVKKPDQTQTGQKLAKPNSPKISFKKIKDKEIGAIIENLESDGPTLLQYAEKMRREHSDKIKPYGRIGDFKIPLSYREITCQCRENGEIYFARVDSKAGSLYKGASCMSQIGTNSRTFNKSGPKFSLHYMKHNNELLQLTISGRKDLISKLKKTYQTEEVNLDEHRLATGRKGGGFRRKIAKAQQRINRVPSTPKLLMASAANLVKFIQDEGLSSGIDFELTLNESKDKLTGVRLTGRKTSHEGIQYRLTGIPELPRGSSFIVDIPDPNTMKITLSYNPWEGKTFTSTLQVNKDGTTRVIKEGPGWMKLEDPERDDSVVEQLQQLIQEGAQFFTDEWQKDIQAREAKIASQDTAEIQAWNHLSLYESMSAPRMIEALEKEVDLIKDYLLANKPADAGDSWQLDEFPALKFDQDNKAPAAREPENIHKKELKAFANNGDDIYRFTVSSSKPILRSSARLITSYNGEIPDSQFDTKPMYKMEYECKGDGSVEIKKYSPSGNFIILTKDAHGKETIGFSHSYDYNNESGPPLSTRIDDLIRSAFGPGFDIPNVPRKEEIQREVLVNLIDKLKISELDDQRISTLENTITYGENSDGKKVYKLYRRSEISQFTKPDFEVIIG